MNTTDYLYNKILSIHVIKCSKCGIEEKEEMKDTAISAAIFQRRGWIADKNKVLCKTCKN